MVDGPNSLEVVLHLLLEGLGHRVDGGELLEVAPLRIVLLLPAVHPLQLVGHVAEDGGVHEGADHHDHDGEDLLVLRVGGHVAEADGGERGAGEVERRDVRVAVLRQHSVNMLCTKSYCEHVVN